MAIYEWRMPVWQFETYNEILAQLELATENSPEWHALVDQLQSLPGYPASATELDHVEPRLSTLR